MADVWVLDASPLIILGQVEKLDRLEQLSSRLLVPGVRLFLCAVGG